MTGPLLSLDADDPCATATALRTSYTNLVAGLGPSRITAKGLGGGIEDTVEFHGGNAAQFLQEVKRWEVLCARSQGRKKPRRFAAVGGANFRRRGQ